MNKNKSLIRILGLKRLKNSFYGNPKLEVECQIGNLDKIFIGKTGTNCQSGYALDGRVGEVVLAEYHFTRQGNLIITRIL